MRRRVTWYHPDPSCVPLRQLFHNFWATLKPWKLKQNRSVADDDYFGGLRVNLLWTCSIHFSMVKYCTLFYWHTFRLCSGSSKLKLCRYFTIFLRELRMLYRVWSLVRCRVTRRLTRLRTMCNDFKYRKKNETIQYGTGSDRDRLFYFNLLKFNIVKHVFHCGMIWNDKDSIPCPFRSKKTGVDRYTFDAFR